ncbi:acyl-CoA dehydrogenase, N-terminal domain protein [Mycobacterium kansasii]|uniref:Acyl-CoA dehydrogenase, N-terminal domain protein n=1 Tax=Mycobacterium kansasii TaxID=1768 RepID=A0A1V3WN84_MYCKA|nr:acyl-CoA dehydrogenase, N-terminal domain protein [Mycobacterium kansasii]
MRGRGREFRFPQEALDALNASGFNAVHVPEEYGGQGADSVAAASSSRRSPASTRPPR